MVIYLAMVVGSLFGFELVEVERRLRGSGVMHASSYIIGFGLIFPLVKFVHGGFINHIGECVGCDFHRRIIS